MIIVAITGASGVIYGIKLLETLNKLNIKNGLIISDTAKTAYLIQPSFFLGPDGVLYGRKSRIIAVQQA